MNKKYNETNFLKENMMGPNSVKILEELIQNIKLNPGMKILDLGCGRGLTSMYLADTIKAQIFAQDLWVGAADNFKRFQEFGFDNIIPIHADAMDMKISFASNVSYEMTESRLFADEFFDALISVDSYHYFGRDVEVMDKHIAPQVKKGGIIAIAIPGLKEELSPYPAEMLLSWPAENWDTMHSPKWWEELLSKSSSIEIISIKEMNCFEEAWNDWLACTNNPYAVGDVKSMNAGAGKYMNIISIVCKRK